METKIYINKIEARISILIKQCKGKQNKNAQNVKRKINIYINELAFLKQ